MGSGIQLRLDGEKLAIVAPKGTLTAELRADLAVHKERLLEFLRSMEQHDLPLLAAQPERLHEPFGLTDVQHAYWMGRNSYVELGGVSTHFYLEYERDEIDLDRLNTALNKLIERHDMLRAIVDA